MRFHCVIISKAIILKMPRLRVRKGKAGCNGRDTMRFQRVIISPEGRILPESRRGARRDTFDRDTFGRNELRPSPGAPPRVLPGPVSAASGEAMKQKTTKQKRTRSRFLTMTCLSKSTFPSFAHQDSHSHHLPVKMYIPVRAMGLSAREPRNRQSKMRGC